MDRDTQNAKVEQSGATLLVAMDGRYAMANDIAPMQWLLDVGVIDSIERGGKRAKYMGFIAK